VTTRLGCGAALAFALLLTASPALALDKQGSAHGGAVSGEDEGFDLSGAVELGLSPSFANPSYAARPNNTGHTLFRYAAHAYIDLIGRKLSIPVDVNMFTDGDQHGARKLVPSEGDLITGLTTTRSVGPNAIELGARFEFDHMLDGTDAERKISPSTQTYADVRGRYLYSFAAMFPGLRDALGDGDVSGWLTLGYFVFNPSYAARPDNEGNALFRYSAHVELSVWHDHLSFGLDGVMFTDRDNKDFVQPTELDLTPEIIGRYRTCELHLAYERDMPLDRLDRSGPSGPALVTEQDFAYLLFVYEFDLVHHQPPPLEDRGHIVSP
jgi:hypothetical protein